MTKSKAEVALEKSIAVLKGALTEEQAKADQAYRDREIALAKVSAYSYAVHTLELTKQVRKESKDGGN